MKSKQVAQTCSGVMYHTCQTAAACMSNQVASVPVSDISRSVCFATLTQVNGSLRVCVSSGNTKDRTGMHRDAHANTRFYQGRRNNT